MSGRQKAIGDIACDSKWNHSHSRPNPALPEIKSDGDAQELTDVSRPKQKLYCKARDHSAPSDTVDSDLLNQNNTQAQIADGFHNHAECKSPMFRETIGNIPSRKVGDAENLGEQKDLKYSSGYLCELPAHP